MKDYIFRLELDASTLVCVLLFALIVPLRLFVFDTKDLLLFVTGVMVWLSALMSTIYLMFDENDFYVFEMGYRK